MTEIIVYTSEVVEEDKISVISGSDYQQFAPPAALTETGAFATDYALLLTDYIRLDGTKEYFPN